MVVFMSEIKRIKFETLRQTVYLLFLCGMIFYAAYFISGNFAGPIVGSGFVIASMITAGKTVENYKDIEMDYIDDITPEETEDESDGDVGEPVEPDA
jgi:hypothetical protein